MHETVLVCSTLVHKYTCHAKILALLPLVGNTVVDYERSARGVILPAACHNEVFILTTSLVCIVHCHFDKFRRTASDKIA